MRRAAVLKSVVTVAALAPAAWLAYGAFLGDLGANPIETITNTTGLSALWLLLVTLTVTPIRRLTGWHAVIRLRRMLGLFAFFYVCLHVLTWSVLDWFFDVEMMVEDVVERPFITVGMLTFLLLVPLAVTSSNVMIRRLGRRWQQLHRLAYVAAITALVHYWWAMKADFRDARLFAVALTVLLAFRAWWMLRTRVSSSS